MCNVTVEHLPPLLRCLGHAFLLLSEYVFVLSLPSESCGVATVAERARPNSTSFKCRRMLFDTGRLLLIFIAGSVATLIGTLVAFKLLPLASLGSDSWKVSIIILCQISYTLFLQSMSQFLAANVYCISSWVGLWIPTFLWMAS